MSLLLSFCFHGTDTGLQRIGKAMANHPKMVNGDGEFCTDLISHTCGRVIGKVGGEGIYCLSLPQKGLGVMVKIVDGNERAVYPVAVHILRQLDLVDDAIIDKLREWNYAPIKDHKGEKIGITLPIFDLLDQKNITVELGEDISEEGQIWNH